MPKRQSDYNKSYRKKAGIISKSFTLEKKLCDDVNYPLSKANGLPASQTSQPTISTGVNSG